MNFQIKTLLNVFFLINTLSVFSQSSNTINAIRDTSALKSVIESIYSNLDSTQTIDLDQVDFVLKSSLILKDTATFFQFGIKICRNYFAKKELNQEAILFLKQNQRLLGNEVSSFGEFDNALGNFYKRLNFYSEATDHYYKSLSWFEKYDPGSTTIPLGNLSSIYFATNEYEKALKYVKLALINSLELKNKNNRLYNIILDYAAIGLNYHELKKDNEAKPYFEKSLNAAEEYGTNKPLFLYSLSQALLFYSETLNYDRCEQLIQYGDKVCKGTKICQSRGGANFALEKNKYYLKIGALDKAIEAETMSSKYSKFKEKETYLYAINYYTKVKDIDNLILNYDKLIAFNDTISVKNRKIAYSNIEEKYANQQLTEKNQELTKNIEKRKKTTSFILFMLTFISSLFVLQLINNRRYKKLNYELQLKKVDLEKTNQELAESNEELERFTFIASHDLKTPLGSIISFTNLLEKQLKSSDNSKVHKYISFIKEGGVRLNNLITDSLEYSKISKKEFDLIKQEIDLNELLNDIEISISGFIEERSARIISLNHLPIIKSHYYSLVTLFQNIIENGIKYNESEIPTIKIRTQEDAAFCTIFIEDNGIGIEEEYRDKVFTMFYRLHNHQEYPGSGLGLSICKKILTRLNGEIYLHSKKSGGSIFEIKLPNSIANKENSATKISVHSKG